MAGGGAEGTRNQACLLACFMAKLRVAQRGPVFSIPLRYEEEVALRATAENEFVALKKVSA